MQTGVLNQRQRIASLLYYAVKLRSLEIVKVLLEYVADPRVRNKFRTLLLHYAVKLRSLEIVKFLLGKGADPRARGDFRKTLLHYAVKLGSLEIVKVLLEYGSNSSARDKFGVTPLHYAVDLGSLEIVKVLLENGANPRARGDLFQKTPLHHAVELRVLEIVKVLLENDANSRVIDAFGKASLHYAVELGCLEIVQAFVKSGADLNVKDANGNMPLHYAVEHGQSACIKILLQAGANVNAKNSQKETPMHVACRRMMMSEHDVKLLLSYRPNLKLKDKDGVSFFDIVKKDKSFLRICLRTPLVLVWWMQDLLIGSNPSFSSNRLRWFPSAAKAVEDFRQDKEGAFAFCQGTRDGQSSNVAKLPNEMVRKILMFSRPSYMSTQKWEKDISKAEELCLGGDKQAQSSTKGRRTANRRRCV